MGRCICFHDGWYFEWSSVTDTPVTGAMTRDEFIDYYRDENGRSGMDGLPARMERAEKTGTSSMHHKDLRELMAFTRMGKNGEEVSIGPEGDHKRATFDDLIAMVLAERRPPVAPAN